MSVYVLDPIMDPRWERFVTSHEHGSVFHTPQWLDALRRSYGYRSVVYTTASPSAELRDGVVLCRIESWITGRRLVGVPFSDHCEPLLSPESDIDPLFTHLEQVRTTEGYRYVELRPFRCMPPPAGFGVSQTFAIHIVDLAPPVDQLFEGLHRDSVQRRIRKADRDGISHHSGTSDSLLRAFYRLLILTRRRHNLPPQPVHWFESLRECLGPRMSIHLGFKGTIPMASIVTLQHGRTLYYKYGASDARYHATGAMPFLLWKAILNAKEAGCERFDLGRTDQENTGLITFKNRFGGSVRTLEYLRRPAPSSASEPRRLRTIPARLVPHMPDVILAGLGRFLYRHLG